MNPAYIHGLNGLRAISLLLVLLAHWAPLQSIDPLAPWGRYGLAAFFVISGFLITRILLDWRDEIDAGRASFKRAAGQFYLRRTLRIFPVYYLCIAVALLYDFGQPVRDDLIWHLTFLANFSAAHQPSGAYTGLAPLWSLCVEEQFYVVWCGRL